MASMQINVAGLEEDSITDGPGLRYVVFAQGCPHRCDGCHNPQTHDFSAGQKYSVEEIFARICRNPLTRGVTFSGGEPFCQAAAFAELGRMLKESGLETAVYSGFTFEQLRDNPDPGVQELLNTADILIDGRFVAELKSLELPFRGSSNQRIIDLPSSMASGHAVPTVSPRWSR